MKNTLPKVMGLIIGLILGLLVSVILVYFMFTARARQIIGVQAGGAAVAQVPTPTEDIADPQVYALLEQADKLINSGKDQEAIDLLLPVIETWKSKIDKGTGYQIMAVAEVHLNHPQQAVPYAQKMCENAPGSFSYQMLARAYEMSGDMPNALASYQQMLLWNDNDSRSDFKQAREEINKLSSLLGTAVPTLKP
jgi:tetratricopeptide (TPR) repeat protein